MPGRLVLPVARPPAGAERRALRIQEEGAAAAGGCEQRMMVIIHPALWIEPGHAERQAWVSGVRTPLDFADFEKLNDFMAGRGSVLDEPAAADQVPESARPEYAGAVRCEGHGCYRAASRALVWATDRDLVITSACARCEPDLRALSAAEGRRVHRIPSPVPCRRAVHSRSDPVALAEYARALVHTRVPGDAAPQPRCSRCRHALAPAPGTASGVTWLDAAGMPECRGSAHVPRPSAIVDVLEGRDGKAPEAA